MLRGASLNRQTLDLTPRLAVLHLFPQMTAQRILENLPRSVRVQSSILRQLAVLVEESERILGEMSQELGGFLAGCRTLQILPQQVSAVEIGRPRMNGIGMEQTQGVGRILVYDGETGCFEQRRGLAAPGLFEQRTDYLAVGRSLDRLGILQMTDCLLPVLGRQMGAGKFHSIGHALIVLRDRSRFLARVQPHVFARQESRQKEKSDYNDPRRAQCPP